MTAPTTPLRDQGILPENSLITGEGWVRVCGLTELTPDRGVGALVGGEQVAVFRLADGSVYAVGNRDPFSGANVMARGMVGSRGDVPTVYGPLFKQAFDLRDGRCLDDASKALPSYPVRIADGTIHVGPREASGT